MRLRKSFKAAAILPGRPIRRCSWPMNRPPSRIRFRRLRRDYETFWISDSDAASRLNFHEACLYFRSRNDQIHASGTGMIEQLFAGRIPLVLQNENGAKSEE
jgi:hypothetical protein